MSKRATVGLALLALFCGGALAQQGATVYGIIDVGVQWNKQYASSTNQQASVWSIDSGYQSGSRFGLRGSEPLGGTFAAIYQLEGGILKYFEHTDGAHYHGGCFVFDERTVLAPDLSAQPSAKAGDDDASASS